MTSHLLAEPRQERLRQSLLRRHALDPDFGDALAALYRNHCEKLPAELARYEPDSLRDAIAAHYGEVLAEPSTRPTFSRMDISDIDELAWRDPRTGELDHPEAARWATGYLTAVRDLATTFGLHRIDSRNDHRAFSGGDQLVHHWCQARAQYGAEVDGRWVALGWVSAGLRPVREKTIVVRSDPMTEDRASARRRGYRQVREALAAIDADWHGIGVERARNPEEERDLEWLYAKVRRGLSYQEISQHWHPESQTDDAQREAARAMVQRAVIRMADAVGIDRTDW